MLRKLKLVVRPPPEPYGVFGLRRCGLLGARDSLLPGRSFANCALWGQDWVGIWLRKRGRKKVEEVKKGKKSKRKA